MINKINSKKAVVFSFLAFFISLIIFAFVYLNLAEKDYTKDEIYKKSRIEFIDSEIKYFKETYLKNAVAYSLHSTLDELLIYVADNPDIGITQNYTKFNELVFHGMYFGNFSDVEIPSLENKTLTHFIDIFNEEFYTNYKGNFSYEVLGVNVYEQNPYYLNVQILGKYKITTIDDISDWEFVENTQISVPIYTLIDPQFYLNENISVQITPSEFMFSDGEWTNNNLIETINNTYSTIYIEPEHEYAIGNSYLNKFLNISRSAYQNVSGYWNFNFDEKKQKIFDNSLYNPNATHYGNSLILFDFEPENINDLTHLIQDIGQNKINAQLIGDLNCSVFGSKNYGCLFNGSNYINISKYKLDLSNTNKVSLSAWIKPSSSSYNSYIFSYSNSSNDNINLKYMSDKKIHFEIGDHNNNSAHIFKSRSNISVGNWTHVVATFDGDSGEGKIFINGFLDNVEYYDEIETTNSIEKFNNSKTNIGIGNIVGGNSYFNGTIDSFAIYSKVLSNLDVSSLLEEKDPLYIDYVDSLYTRALNFDGENDHIEIEQNIFNDELENFAIEFWIIYDEIHYNLNQTLLQLPFNSTHNVLELNIINSSKIEFYSLHNNVGNSLFADFNFEINNNYHIVFNYYNNKKSIYINDYLYDSGSVGSNLNQSNRNLSIGVLKENSINLSNYFYGNLDELKIYSVGLKETEIEQNYLNYNTFGSGCCNYLTLVNPNKFGYNETIYKKNISYSSKLFYDYYINGLAPNITLSNFTLITSQNPANNFYNFLFDECVTRAFYIEELQDFGNDIIIDWVVAPMDSKDNKSCSNLVKMGIY